MIKSAEKPILSSKKQLVRARIIQSAMSGVYIFLVFLALHSLQNKLAIASLGASAFIAFVFPDAQSSKPRFLIGGYCMGAASGWICNGLGVLFYETLPIPSYIPACALAVTFSMLLMTAFTFEHPPSAALAIAVTIDPNPIVLSLAGISCILLLCIIKHMLKKYLQNLQR